MDIQLKPCPFCGEEIELNSYDYYEEQQRYESMTIRCEYCGARGPESNSKFIADDWNKRGKSYWKRKD